MKVLFILESEDLAKALRLTLRLRWPAMCDTTFHDGTALENSLATEAELLFIDTPSLYREGIGLLAKLRDESKVGIIVLSCEPNDEEMLAVLEAGADDYLPGSFSPSQLVARASALLRRIQPAPQHGSPVIQCGSLQIDPQTHEICVSDRYAFLTPTEFKASSMNIGGISSRLPHAHRVQRAVSPGGSPRRDRDGQGASEAGLGMR